MDIYNEYVQLARLALEGKQRDSAALLKRTLRFVTKSRPEIAEEIKKLLHENKASEITRSVAKPIPIDLDSKLELLRKDFEYFEQDPMWPENVFSELHSIIKERQQEEKLLKLNLYPTRSILFVGPPGVGKTLAARWISYKINRPLLTLDLAAVMSSYLGKTGNNIRAVLNYARNNTSVLLLDEFDSIAKRRNDELEVGELKRLVTVILQTIDEWPFDGLLIAATNHAELLDPAVWRRFERVIEFPLPSLREVRNTIISLVQNDTEHVASLVDTLTFLFSGSSYADVERHINNARKDSVIKQITLVQSLEELAIRLCKNSDKNKKIEVANYLMGGGCSQRKASELTGISRDTLRKHTNRRCK